VILYNRGIIIESAIAKQQNFMMHTAISQKTTKEICLSSLRKINFEYVEVIPPTLDTIEKISDMVFEARKNNFWFSQHAISKQQLSNFLFFLRVLDFRLWEHPRNWKEKPQDSSFWGLYKKIENISKFGFLKIDQKDFVSTLSPHESTPLAIARWNVFQKSRQWLLENWEGDFKNFADHYKSAVDFCLQLCSLEKFQDITESGVHFLKPNQLLYLEYVLALGDPFTRRELCSLTAFADYKLSQMLHMYGALRYSDKLEETLRKNPLLQVGSQEEVEIRAGALLAVEMLREQIGSDVCSYEVDVALWNGAHGIDISSPVHRVRSLYY